MSFTSLEPLENRSTLFAVLRQEQLGVLTDTLGEHRWDVDMQAGTLTFSSLHDPQRRIECRAHFIASIAPGPRSLLWGWAHPNGDPNGQAAALRAYGEANGITELTRPELPLPDLGDDPAAGVAQIAHQIGAVAIEITGRSPYYSSPLGGGSRAVFMLEAPLPPLTLAEALPSLPRLIGTLPLRDARTAVWGLAQHAGWQLEWSDAEFTGARLTDGSTNAANFTFDEAGRITGLQASLTQP